MKLAPRDTDRFFKAPSNAYQAILIYGADDGLVRTRRDALLSAWGIDKQNPFTYQELEPELIIQEPSRLYDALRATSLTGESPCIVIRQAGNTLTPHIKQALQDTGSINRLLVTGGDLAKNASLRGLFDDAKQPQLLSVACYRDEGNALAYVIRQFFKERHIQAQADVIPLLASRLGNDHAVTRAELEKIDLYLGTQRTLTTDTVVMLLGDNQHMLLSDAALSWISGNQSRFIMLADQLLQSGENPVALLRILCNYVQRLIVLQQQCQQGKTPAQALESARPPVFFKEKPLFQHAMQQWSLTALIHLLADLVQLEADIKRTPLPAILLLQRLTQTDIVACEA